MFNEKDRNKLYESLKTEEGVKRFFGKNREKFTRDIEDQKMRCSNLENANFDNEWDKQLSQISILTIQKTLEMVKDVLDLLEISFLHRIDTRDEFKELITIIQEKGKNQESKLDKLQQKLSKHDPSLEWIDNYFKRSGETSHE
jgi:hypothetical protein